MIGVERFGESDGDRAWDAFVGSHPHGLVYHLSVWARVIESSFPHIRGYRIGLTDADGRLVAGLPVYLVRSWLTGNRLVSIPFATLSDPLVRDSKDVSQLEEEANKLATSARCRCIDIRAFQSAALWAGGARGAAYSGFKHHDLELAADPEVVRRRFHRKAVRPTITYAYRSGLECRLAENEGDLRDFYRYYAGTRKRKGLPSQPYEFFRQVWSRLCPLGYAEYLLVLHEGRVAGGLLTLKYKGRVCAEHLGYDDAISALHPSYPLFWESIRQACLDGYKVYSFGRTAISNTGLLAFKRRWGTIESDLPQFFYPASAAPSDVSRQESLPSRCLQRLIRSAPGPLAGWISRVCYRHLG